MPEPEKVGTLPPQKGGEVIDRQPLTDEQKKVVDKAIVKTKTVKKLIDEFKRSFKVMELRHDPTGDYYVVWSAALNRVVKVPAKELEEGGPNEKI